MDGAAAADFRVWLDTLLQNNKNQDLLDTQPDYYVEEAPAE